MRQSELMSLMCMAAVVLSLVAGPQRLAAATGPDLDHLLTEVEHHYNRAQTLSVYFTESYSIAGRKHRPESGQLLLRKPGRMRWIYSEPAGKLFVSDGHNVYLYTADDNRVEQSKLKASQDMRAPLAFLLGKLEMKKEFRSFETKPAQNGTYLLAEAKNDRVPYGKVQMLIGQGFEIKELTVDGRDGSVLHFSFRDEVVNPAIADQDFHFVPPPGADVVQAVTTESGDN
jgi:outer membrane lipoprotein carrier protein